MTSGGLAAVSASAFAALYSAFGKYDVVHIHAEGPAFFSWLPKMFGKRVVVTIHGIDWQREKWQSGLGSKFIHQGEKNAVKYADEVIVLSKGVQGYFKETYGRETHFIPNGVNRPQIREASLITDKFGLKKDSYILFLGRLVPEKGIRYLVEAFKNVKTDKKLVIAGGSSDTDSFMEELKELAKGDDRILFTGFVQGAMLDELYSNAYIYTLPSDLEGMPLSLLEAMSYGNCCLVSDIPECAEVVEDKEAFFPNGKKLFGRDRHPAECRCRQATREKQEKEERARLHYEKVQRLKLQGFTDWAMQHWTFANDHGQNPQMQLAQRYVAHWPEMREKNVGLLLWGGVGTGKSFMAGCIANALMEQEVAVCMTNFARIMNELNNAFSGRNEVVDRLCGYPLLVIDDFGMERGTEYVLEQIYNIIDSRYRSRKPLIVTTNLTLTELKAFVIPGYKFAEENTAKYNPIPYSLVLTLIS